jgi:iron complex transport system ATP-binding protein
MEQGPVLVAQGVTCGYDGRKVLQGVDLALPQGDFLGVLGPNGSGKSTLVKALSGVLPLESGEVRLFGRPLSTLSRREIARRLAVVPQSTSLFFSFSVLDIVLMGRTPHLSRWRSEQRTDYDIARQALERVDALHLQDRPVTELSSGERQRVFIARALAQEPEILLLDEPTTYLDINHQLEIFEFLRQLNEEQHLTLLCVSHDLNLAAEYCRRLLLLHEGRVFAQGPPEQILTAEHLAAVYHVALDVHPNPLSGRPQVSIAPRAPWRNRPPGSP